MATIYLISDTHFGHANILNFKQADGSPMRPFKTVDEMDWTMVKNWNSIVRPSDHVYHLGDVAMKWAAIKQVMPCLMGKLRLVRGNHDIAGDTKQYMQFFEEIYGIRVLDNLAFTHIPMHPASIKPQWVNVHGHLHNNTPQGAMGPQYYNVSVEMIDYAPIELGHLKDKIRSLYGSKVV